MCTLVVDLAPGRQWPLLLAAVRDEMLDRAWRAPGRHWPDRPDLVGGLDLRAGGTWLALDTRAGRVACVLNGRGRPAPPRHRQSRGELPLRAAATGATDRIELSRYDPFHLVVAGPTGIQVLGWDGEREQRYRPGPGTHLFTNDGRWVGPGDARSPRAERFGPAFAAGRPDPAPHGLTDPDWRPWLDLFDPALVSPDDPRALLPRRAHDGQVWGASSITLLALRPDRVRYDFNPTPFVPAWHPVPVDRIGS